MSSGKFLEFFNLWRNLHMFLDTMEPRTENKKSSLDKNCFDNEGSDMWKIPLIVHKITSKIIICNLRRDLHMFLDNIELRIENKN